MEGDGGRGRVRGGGRGASSERLNEANINDQDSEVERE